MTNAYVLRRYLGSFLMIPLTLGLTGCPQSVEDPVAPVPLYEILTGSLYVQNGPTFPIKIQVSAPDQESNIKYGFVKVGGNDNDARYETDFTVTVKEEGSFFINGNTQECNYSDCSYSNDWKEIGNLGLRVVNEEVFGSTPTVDDPLVWKLTRTLDKGDPSAPLEMFTGIIWSTTFELIEVATEFQANGTIYGTVRNGRDTVVMNGYVDAEVAARVPAAGPVALLINSALMIIQ